jgi:hypothetical protein
MSVHGDYDDAILKSDDHRKALVVEIWTGYAPTIVLGPAGMNGPHMTFCQVGRATLHDAVSH